MMAKKKTVSLESMQTATVGEQRLAQAVVVVREASLFKVGGSVPQPTETRYFVGAVGEPGDEEECAFAVGDVDFIEFNRQVLAGEQESLDDYPCVDAGDVVPGCEDLDDTFFSPFIDLVVDAVNAMRGYKVGSDGRAVLPE